MEEQIERFAVVNVAMQQHQCRVHLIRTAGVLLACSCGYYHSRTIFSRGWSVNLLASPENAYAALEVFAAEEEQPAKAA